METELQESRMLKVLNEEVIRYRSENLMEISYDSVVSNVLKKIDWKFDRNLKTKMNYFHEKEKFLVRVEYYYSQFIKEMTECSQINLSRPLYLDFWKCVSIIQPVCEINRYKTSVVLKKDYFSFLRDLKIFIDDSKFSLNFKLKVLKILEIRKEERNG